jgi:hypothetical protein
MVEIPSASFPEAEKRMARWLDEQPGLRAPGWIERIVDFIAEDSPGYAAVLVRRRIRDREGPQAPGDR